MSSAKPRRESNKSGGASTPEGVGSDDDYSDSANFDSPTQQRKQTSAADAHMRSDIITQVSRALSDQKRANHQANQKKLAEERDREHKREWRWSKALDELLETERKYVRDLNLIRRVFILPLERSIDNPGPGGKPILEARLKQTVFSDIEIFLKLHEEQFLPGLEEAVKNGGYNVGKFFTSHASVLKMYTSFINKHEEIIALLAKEEMDNMQFRQFKQRCYEDPQCEKLKLNDYLIKPLHRLTRYALLLRELEKNCTPERQDVKLDLNTAITKVSAVTSLVNDRVRDAENRRKVVSISEELQNIIPNLIQPARRYVSDSSFNIVTETGTIGPVVNVFVFNDLVVTATRIKEFFKETYSVKQFEVSSMLLQLNVPVADAKYHAIRLYNKQLNHVDICSENSSTTSDLAITLLRVGVLLEASPYPPHRQIMHHFPECTVVIFGDKECGKSQFIKTLKTARNEILFAIDDDSGTTSPRVSRDRASTSGEVYEEFTLPLDFQKLPHNVTVLDSFSDERLNPLHKQTNRELWRRADVMVFVLNLEKDYKTEYWKSELLQASYKRGTKPPVVVVTCHDSHEPKKTDPACVAVCRTLGAALQVSCLTSSTSSTLSAMEGILSQVAKAKESRRPNSLNFLGMEVTLGK